MYCRKTQVLKTLFNNLWDIERSYTKSHLGRGWSVWLPVRVDSLNVFHRVTTCSHRCDCRLSGHETQVYCLTPEKQNPFTAIPWYVSFSLNVRKQSSILKDPFNIAIQIEPAWSFACYIKHSEPVKRFDSFPKVIPNSDHGKF